MYNSHLQYIEAQQDRSLHRSVYVLILVCLLFSVTNAVPFAAGFVLLWPLAFIVMVREQKVPAVVLPMLITLAFFATSALLYSPQVFVEPQFYRRDGNIFITVAPFVGLALLNLRVDVRLLFKKFVIYATLVNVVTVTVWLAKGGSGIYPFLFVAHNASGGFLAMLAMYALGLFLASRHPLWAALFVINAFTVVLTVSRGSILALAAAVFLLFAPRIWRWITLSGVIAVNGALVAWAYGQVNLQAVLHKDVFHNEFLLENLDPATGSIGNVAVRLFDQWPSSVWYFLQSPLVGIGFGGFNDPFKAMEGLPGLIAWKGDVIIAHGSSHAHHTYFNILAETGAIGLGLFVWSLVAINRFINRIPDKALRLGLMGGFWVAVFSSFTEHRLVIPSQMFGFFTFLGLCIATRHMWGQSDESNIR